MNYTHTHFYRTAVHRETERLNDSAIGGLAMRKTTLFLMVLVLGSFLIFEPAGAQDRRRGNNTSTSISTGPERTITECGQVRMRIGDGETARSQLVQTVPRSAVSTLQVRSTKN